MYTTPILHTIARDDRTHTHTCASPNGRARADEGDEKEERLVRNSAIRRTDMTGWVSGARDR